MNARSSTRRLAALLAAVAVMAVAAVAAASSASATPSADKTLRVGVQSAYSMTPIFVALRHGYFKQAGIEKVEFTLFQSLPAMFAALAGGQLDLAAQTVPAVAAYNRATTGPKLKYIAPLANDAVSFTARSGSGIPVATKTDWKPTILALKGKKVGVPAPGGIVDLFLRSMLKDVGLSASDVQIFTVGAANTAVAALSGGIVDVIGADLQTEALARKQGIGANILAFGLGQGPPELLGTFATGYLASDSRIGEDRELFISVTNALVKARAYMANPKNKGNMLDLLTRKVGLSAEEAARMYEVGIPLLSSRTALNRATLGRTFAAFVKAGVITIAPPAYPDIAAPFGK